MSEYENAAFILRCTSDRDVLGLSQSGPLSREGIQKAFHARVLRLHPDKTRGEGPLSESSSVVAAFEKLMDARHRLLELLPLSQLLWSQSQSQPLSAPSFQESSRDSPPVFQGATSSEPLEEYQTAASMLSGLPTDVSVFPLSPTKCNTFGCLRTLTDDELQRGVQLCVCCRSKPRKCVVFGCLRMVTGEVYCSEHRP
jgi:hypothetical protein